MKTNYLNENYMNTTAFSDLFISNQLKIKLTKKSKSQKKSLKGETKEKMPERHQCTKEEKAALTRQFCKHLNL
ncbi:hypothetical protein KUTeg_006338 [Tegillarca granosa]|uniref:Uncharacterized protein n=1 Tax=Tegillarca granosa TaxID=220873 RepID=A0ABQ9FGA2_TEGGR|nr:hypothetical protein KUTeg_006338 [Tegillarca granosa]